jgi:hypothetical protein
MIRALIIGLVGIIAAAFVRALVGMIFKEMGDMMKQEKASGGEAGQAAPPGSAGAALKKCQVCGTYTTPERLLGGAYCSAACQEKARAA